MRVRCNKRLIGLDIGSSAIKAIELQRGWKGLRVKAFAIQPLPLNSIVDGRFADSTSVTAAVQTALAAPGFSKRNVATALSDSTVIVKRITLAPRDSMTPAASLQSEIEGHVRFDSRDISVDYVIHEPESTEIEPRTELLVVIAKKERIGEYSRVLADAKRTASVVDVEAFALQNAYHLNYETERGPIVALLDVGASAIKVNVVSGARSMFSRVVSPGGRAFTEAVQKELRLPFDVAEQVKTATHQDASLIDAARPVLRAMIDRTIHDIAKAFEHFKSAGTGRIDRMVITGGGSLLDGFLASVRERFETRVEPFDPFRRVPCAVESIAPFVGVAVGLALRRGAER